MTSADYEQAKSDRLNFGKIGESEWPGNLIMGGLFVIAGLVILGAACLVERLIR